MGDASESTSSEGEGGFERVRPVRQILIVGRTPAGVLLATYLAHAGHEPLLIGDRVPPPGSSVGELRESGASVLHRLGIHAPIEEAGRAIETIRLQIDTGTNRDTVELGEADAEARQLYAVDPARITDPILSRLPDDVVRSGWEVRDFTPHRRGIEIEFVTGVREWFDLVVVTNPEGFPAGRTRLGETGGDTGWLARFECELHLPDVPTAEQFVATTPTGMSQLVPLSDPDRALFRLIATSAPIDEPGSIEAWRGTHSTLFHRDVAGILDRSVLGESEVTTVLQSGGVAGNWNGDRLACCGSAAYPTVPESGIGLSLALEDAWVLANELAFGPRSVLRAIRKYARRRRRRLRDVLQRGYIAAHEFGLGATSQVEPLSTVTSLRALVLNSVSTNPTLDGGPLDEL